MRQLLKTWIVTLSSWPVSLFAAESGSPLTFVPKKDVAMLSAEDVKKIVQPFVNASRFQFLMAPGHRGEGSFELSAVLPVGGITDSSRELAVATFANADGSSLSTAWPRYVFLPRMGLTFGLPNAFDAGVQFGWLPYSKLYSYGLGVQATLIDGPASSPVVTARVAASFLKSASKPVIDGSALSFELLAGTRLPDFEPYVGFGGAAFENRSSWRFNPQTKDYASSWNEVYLCVGAQALLLPYLQTTAEIQVSSAQWIVALKFGTQIL